MFTAQTTPGTGRAHKDRAVRLEGAQRANSVPSTKRSPAGWMARLREVSYGVEGQRATAERRVGSSPTPVLDAAGHPGGGRPCPARRADRARGRAPADRTAPAVCRTPRNRSRPACRRSDTASVVELSAEIGLRRTLRPGGRAIRPEAAEPRVLRGDQQVAVRQRHRGSSRCPARRAGSAACRRPRRPRRAPGGRRWRSKGRPRTGVRPSDDQATLARAPPVMPVTSGPGSGASEWPSSRVTAVPSL